MYYADPAQPLTTANEELDDLDHDLREVCTIFAAHVPHCAGEDRLFQGGVLPIVSYHTGGQFQQWY